MLKDVDKGDIERFLDQNSFGENPLTPRLDTSPENVSKGLLQLVLTLVEVIRELMEKQAIRRMEGNSLTEEEIERLGTTFMMLDDKMKELKEFFGLTDDDLNINLGPLGNLR